MGKSCPDDMPMPYEVIICGGGLAGLTLARQLKLQCPETSVLILEKSHFPLPVSTAKVGESTVEISAFYFENTLNLSEYFKNEHFKKLGLRYFSGHNKQPFNKRPELGLSKFPGWDSFQIDRGILENDLYRENCHMGIPIQTGVIIKEVNLSSNNEPHKVICKDRTSGKSYEYKCRWVVDALGRCCFIQNKLNLKVAAREKFSSVWFRVAGRLDLDNFVSMDETEWHTRVPYRSRYFSTNHILGKGYWIWLIPLASGNTSVGIVAAENEHPFQDYNSKESCLEWLRENEPIVAEAVQKHKMLDFGRIRNYSYSSQQVFSDNRWACTGEAALFSDPYYSPGSNMIGFENTIITDLILKDKEGRLSKIEIDRYNNFIISLNAFYTETIQSGYSYFHLEQLQSLSYLWDLTVGWAFLLPQMFNAIYLDSEVDKIVREETRDLLPLASRVRQLFKQWERVVNNRFTYSFIDYLSVPFIKEIYDRNLCPGKSRDELKTDHRMNMVITGQFALAIFLLAVEDAYPQLLNRLRHAGGLNPLAISLKPEKWDIEGLFDPVVSRDELEPVYNQIRNLFTFYQTSEADKELVAEDSDLDFTF